MIFRWNTLLGSDATASPRRRVALEHWPAAVYAIGDVHGCLTQLRLLHDKILTDAATITGDKLIVCCGDYVDRGPDAAGVLDFLSEPLPSGFTRICLEGNHEAMMLDHIANPASGSDWFRLGGMQTLQSYGLDIQDYVTASPQARLALLQTHLPDQHLAFLRGLPLVLTLPGYIFVHAGIRPGIALERQSETDLLWIRDEFFDAADRIDGVVVHGHTPSIEPVSTAHRICVDTGAFATGTLTAARIVAGAPPVFIQASAPIQRS